MRQNDVTPEVWNQHRKLRKKIASAKWYAHKKQREIDEQCEHRRRLEEELRLARSQYLWPDDRDRALWFGVVAHHSWGYPVRPPRIDPLRWRSWIEDIETDIDALEETVRDIHDGWAARFRETWFRKILRQLAIRERQASVPRWNVPRGCPNPHTEGRPWMTSVWNWLWLISHLGNHREDFTVLWNHLHQEALLRPVPPGGWTEAGFLTALPNCRTWIHWMSQNLTDHLRVEESQGWPDSPPSSQEPPTDDESPDRFVTQFNTPDWYQTTDDSDSESLPSSLDQFVTEAFASECPPLPDPVHDDPPIEWPPSASPNSRTAS